MISDRIAINYTATYPGGWRWILTSLIWLIVVVLVVMWLLGFSFHIAGNLIFLLLVVAIAGVVYNLLAGGMWGGGAAHHHHHTEVTEVDREV